jgi:hypothetical protein
MTGCAAACHSTRSRREWLSVTALLVWALCSGSTALASDTDVVTMRNGDRLTGDIKRLQYDKLKFDPDYIEGTVDIDWQDVAGIQSGDLFVFVLTNGVRYTGSPSMDPDDPDVFIVSEKLRIPRSMLVEFRSIKDNFWARWKVDLYIGYTLTKANNYNQVSARTDVRYPTDKAETKLSVNSLLTTQKNVDASHRIEGSLSWQRALKGLWFANTDLTTLHSTEQGLDLRTTTSLSGGRYLFRTTKASLSASAGVAWTREYYIEEIPGLDSAEGVLTTVGDVFGIQDFRLTSSVVLYPSFTESGRLRTNFDIDVSWEIIEDFDFLINYWYNLDNKPPPTANGNDYGLVTSVGWSL